MKLSNVNSNDDIIAFIEARLDEDGAAAKAAASVAGPDWWFDLADSYLKSPPGSFVADTMNAPYGDEEIGPFLARHDPARALREAALKRAILGQYRTAAGWSSDNRPLSLRVLAAVWSDHPDYEGWLQ